MSGAPSVPLTIAAIFIESVWAKIGLAMLAVFCLGLASFLVWRQERERALGLEQRLKPKFTFGFVKSDTLCDVNTHFPDKEEVRFLRLRGETLTRSEVVNCSGRLTCIRKPDGKLMEVNLVLPFAPAEEADYAAKLIRDGIPEHVDIIALTKGGRALLAVRRFALPNAYTHEEIFRAFGKYTLDIAIASSNAPTEKRSIIFDWTGDWQTASMADA